MNTYKILLGVAGAVIVGLIAGLVVVILQNQKLMNRPRATAMQALKDKHEAALNVLREQVASGKASREEIQAAFDAAEKVHEATVKQMEEQMEELEAKSVSGKFPNQWLDRYCPEAGRHYKHMMMKREEWLSRCYRLERLQEELADEESRCRERALERQRQDRKACIEWIKENRPEQYKTGRYSCS